MTMSGWRGYWLEAMSAWVLPIPDYLRSCQMGLDLVDDSACASGEVMVSYLPFSPHGEVAQLVEHHVRNVGVVSSNLIFSTIR